MLIGAAVFIRNNKELDKKHFGMSLIDAMRYELNIATERPVWFYTDDENAKYDPTLGEVKICTEKEFEKNKKAIADELQKVACKKCEVRSILDENNDAMRVFYAFTNEDEDKLYGTFDEGQAPDIDETDRLLGLFAGYEYAIANDPRFAGLFHEMIIEMRREEGVEFIDGDATYVDATVKFGEGCVIYPNVYLEGNTVIGNNTILYPGCRLINSTIGNNCVFQFVTANEATVEDNVSIGPYVNLRPKTVIKNDCKIGDFVEVKNSTVGTGSKLPHLSYIGDSDIGERVNVGCGTVFVNYDGKNKYRTTVGNDVFIGCNSNLVAPVTVGNNVYIAAGSTLTDDVPDNAMAIARARQVNKMGWVPPYARKKD